MNDEARRAGEADAARPMEGDPAPAAAATGAKADAAEQDVSSDDIQHDLDDLRRDLEKTTDRYLRLAAEFDNYRKRIERERAEHRVRAQAELVARLLDAMDDLDRVSEYPETTPTRSLLDGVQLVEKKLMQTLASFGLESVDAAGAVFDPSTMEALATVEAEHMEEDDIVSDVFQPGYTFKGQLLRPARVRVKKYEA